MILDRSKQRQLTRWLKEQGILDKRYLRFSVMLGSLSGVLLVAQAFLLAMILQSLIIDKVPRDTLDVYFLALVVCFILRAGLTYFREKVGFKYGTHIRQRIRQNVLDRLNELGPAYIKSKPVGSWATIIVEQIDEMQDFYARYLPQMMLAATVPFIILIAIFPINWAAGLILFVTAPLIPLFMALVGMGAAESSRKNFETLSRLSGQFLDRLKGLSTIRLFHRGDAEVAEIAESSESLRKRTMDVLKLAFLSSACLEFFTSISIALVAVYFGFSFLGQFHFGGYGVDITLFAGFIALILAPEFYQPLRDLGTFYHAKAQAIGAADSLYTFMTETADIHQQSADNNEKQRQFAEDYLELKAENCVVMTLQHKPLTEPLNFSLANQQKVAIIGRSGAGKTSLIQALLGFLPYSGSLTVNGVELRDYDIASLRKIMNWVGQNPSLPAKTVKENIELAAPDATEAEIARVLHQAHIDEFLPLLPHGLDTEVGDDAVQLSVGQTQRIAVARALLKPSLLLLLDEPTASLDALSANFVRGALNQAAKHQTTLVVTHQIHPDDQFDQIIEIKPLAATSDSN